MPLTYAGVPLTELTESLSLVADRYWDRHAPDLWSWPAYDQDGMHHLPVPAMPKPQRARLNTLVWPTGASRWATFHALIPGAAARAVLAAVVGDSPAAAPLVISQPQVVDGVAHSVTAQMYCLGVRPVFVGDPAADLWWMTLVDSRYFWWQQRNEYAFDPGDSWTTLLTNLCVAASGVAPTVTAVSGNYGVPYHARWHNPDKPLPLLIDAAAVSVGKRFLAQMNGTLEYVDPTSAAAVDAAQYALCSPHLVMGSRHAVADVAGNVPANVAVSFWGDTSDVRTKSLASLAIPGYGTITGVAGAYAWVVADVDASASNTAKNNYLAQAATDYYLWAASVTDCTFRLPQPLVSTGFEDRIEWEYYPGNPPGSSAPTRVDTAREGLTPPTRFVPGAHPRASLDWRLPRERVVTRVVPLDWADRNQYGDRPPVGYSYRVRLLSTNGTAWKAQIRATNQAGTAVVDGPQLGWGADEYCLWSDGNVKAGQYGVALPDPFTAGRWVFNPSPPAKSVVDVCPVYGSGSGAGTVVGIRVQYVDSDGTVTCVVNPGGCCVSYNCVAGVCVDPGDGTGAYPTLAACRAACATYNCIAGSGSGSAGTCVAVYDGTGAYPTLAACETACGGTFSYDCVSGVCSYRSDSGGTYASLSACVSGCGPGAGDVVTSCSADGVPVTLYATFSGGSAAPCTTLDGVTVALHFYASVPTGCGPTGVWWGYHKVSASCYLAVVLYCCGTPNQMVVGTASFASAPTPSAYGGVSVPFTTAPFHLLRTTGDYAALFGCGDGRTCHTTITVTE